MRKCCALAPNASLCNRSERLSKQEQCGMRVAEYRVNRRERRELPQRPQTSFESFSTISAEYSPRPLRLTIFVSAWTALRTGNRELTTVFPHAFRLHLRSRFSRGSGIAR